MTVMFIISSWVIHCFFSTQVFSISAIMAYPPPKVNSPTFAKDRKRSSSMFISAKVDQFPAQLCSPQCS